MGTAAAIMLTIAVSIARPLLAPLVHHGMNWKAMLLTNAPTLKHP